ncbi:MULTISPECIES: tetraacyldisaccharide 4'-kinase [unclassified Robiginitalea]|uniref:tetraacyldisaccharide 4'-kinase n=1 Tax=Robiginitalea TaxID=252306 RepID=UPI00234AA0E5|nr:MULTISPECIES: tetraacyldisaccharide 4'-kinase [unclassified Robiginitalea]MDC6354662.1 tetraacyldisaccharide 4'-kinase [Robiginitalea sp. PM2]MDC6374656.1 tetraacyldisaccharide 4'-kinase [Robiginitalea sp. SP8]
MEVIRKLLWPFSLVYAAAVWLRNLCYDRGWCASESFATPVLCIGNLSVGGTGKTPMVEWVLRRLQARRAAVLSRGYRRRSRGFVLAGPDTPADDLGDEPAQIALKFPRVTVAVDADRRRGIRKLTRQASPDLIILDDGFQHRKVRPAGSILLTCWGALYPDQGYLPSGDLRDHKSQARRAGIIAVTKCPELPDPETRAEITRRLRPEAGQRVVFARLDYSDVRDSAGRVVSPEQLREKPFTLVTGIANPEPLVRHLKELDLVFEHMEFPDHHRFSPREIDALRSRKRILTTEKDAARLGSDLTGHWVIGVAHQFGEADEKVLMEFIDSL